MLLLLSATTTTRNCLDFCPPFCSSRAHTTPTPTPSTLTHSHSPRPPLSLSINASSSSSPSSLDHSLLNPNPNSSKPPHHLFHTCLDDEDDGGKAAMVSSATALAAAIRKASTSPVEFLQRFEKDGKNKGLVLPSPDFQRLCLEQLDLFRRIVDPGALLSVYVRPAGSYVMDRLELRRVTFYPGVNAADIVILVANFSVPTGLRVAEASLSKQQAELVPECRAVVFPMVKHPFVVGFLVAELPKIELESRGLDLKPFTFSEGSSSLPPRTDSKSWQIQTVEDNPLEKYKFTAEQRLNAMNISCSLAMAYVMDQKAMLLQQSSWQNNVRMSNLVEQIRGPLSSIRTLSKMLSVQLKRSEISYDIIEDILVQGDRMKDTLQQLQDAANIVRYNEETLEKMHHSESSISQVQESGGPLSHFSTNKDLEMPMPPLALAPLQLQNIRPCNVSDVLADLVGAVEPLARNQRRVVELCELSQPLCVAVEEPVLRQALSNLIEGALLRTQVGGKVEIVSTTAPAGGALVIIDDDGPDMHYMTQMHSLTSFGADLFSEGMVEDNMTWNFVAGLTVAREILESYGSVVRVISPRTMESSLGSGGTRVELWLPTFSNDPDQEGIE